MLSTTLLPFLLAMQAVAAPEPEPEGTILTNEEQVYFAREAGRPPPPWVGVRVILREGARMLQPVDAFGQEVGPAFADTGPLPFAARGFEQNGQRIDLRVARPFYCWVSVRRFADRAAGQADWSFDRNLSLHDQGGRVLVAPEGAPPVVIRMRHVVWPPPSTNRPSLVLYVHRPDSPDRAESYSWADPDARMVGINLRWVQASCTRDGD